MQSSVSGKKVQSGGNVSVKNQWNMGVVVGVPEVFQPNSIAVGAAEF